MTLISCCNPHGFSSSPWRWPFWKLFLIDCSEAVQAGEMHRAFPDASQHPRSRSLLPVLMLGARGAHSPQLWGSTRLILSISQAYGRCGLTFGNGDWTAQVTVLLQLIESHFLQPGSLQLREALDGDGSQPHTAARHAVPGEITLQSKWESMRS